MSDLIEGNAVEVLRMLAAKSAQACVTSPPYFGKLDYGDPRQIGLEPSVAEYVDRLCAVFDEVARVLTPSGVLFLDLGDSYGGVRGNKTPAPDNKRKRANADTPGHAKQGTQRKQLLGIPWRVAFALQERGWYLRNAIVWDIPNAKPESVADRFTGTHEYVFLLTRSERYHIDLDAVRLPNGARRRDVWSINNDQGDGDHAAVMPEKLAALCILAGSQSGDTVLDPFVGSGTTAVMAHRLKREYIGVDLHIDLAQRRIGRERVRRDLWNISA